MEGERLTGGTSRDRERQMYRAHCSDCDIQTEERHTLRSARELCEMHNENRGGCEAEPVPLCWVCFNRATHRNQKPPHEYTCDEHAVSIDMVPLEEVA